MGRPNVNVDVGGPKLECVYKTKVLRPDIDFKLQVTEENTKYVVKSNFVLGEVVSGSADVSAGNISQCENPEYRNAYTAYENAHNAWIAADNNFTIVNNSPSSTSDEKNAALEEKMAAYEVLSAATQRLQGVVQYYYYAGSALTVKKGQYVELPEGCVLLNENLNAIVDDLSATQTGQQTKNEVTVYVGSAATGNYNYKIATAVNMPRHCLIEFDGGSVSNGALVGDDTVLIAYQDDYIILKDVELFGTWKYVHGDTDIIEEPVEEGDVAVFTADKKITGRKIRGCGLFKDRPTDLEAEDAGYVYWCTDRHYPIWWGSDSKWYDASGNEIGKETPNLAWSPATLVVAINNIPSTMPVLTGAEGLNVTYSSNNESVATVDENGVIHIVAAGDNPVTITATSQETADYNSATAECQITVSKATAADNKFKWMKGGNKVTSDNYTIGESEHQFPSLVNEVVNPDTQQIVAVTYDSDNKNVADFDGNTLNIKNNIGSAKIQAIIEDLYWKGTAEYILNVSESYLNTYTGHGATYGSAEFVQTVVTKINNNTLIELTTNNDYGFIKTDKKNNITSLKTYHENPQFRYNVELDAPVVDGEYKYYKTIYQLRPGTNTYIINEQL